MKIEARWVVDLHGKRQSEQKQQNKTVLEENVTKSFKIGYKI